MAARFSRSVIGQATAGAGQEALLLSNITCPRDKRILVKDITFSTNLALGGPDRLSLQEQQIPAGAWVDIYEIAVFGAAATIHDSFADGLVSAAAAPHGNAAGTAPSYRLATTTTGGVGRVSGSFSGQMIK